MAETFEVTFDPKDYGRFARAVKDVDEQVAKALRKRMGAAAKPITEEVRKAALNLPSQQGQVERAARGEHGVGLRQGMAMAVEQKIRTSGKNGLHIRIRISGTKFNEKTGKPKKLPRYVEGFGRKPWRHPVFAEKGKTNGSWQGAWVVQKSTPFLVKTVLPHKKEMQKAVYDSFVDALKQTHLIGQNF